MEYGTSFVELSFSLVDERIWKHKIKKSMNMNYYEKLRVSRCSINTGFS